MFSNTDYPALILAVVALISPAFVEWLRQIYDTKKTDKENQRRADELKAENIRRDKERREEYNQRKIERQEEYEQTNHVNRRLEQRELVIDYIDFCNDYLNEININLIEDDMDKSNRVSKSIYKVKKQRSKIVASFVNQRYWEEVTGLQNGLRNYFDNILLPDYENYGITNTVEYICSLIENETATGDFIDEIKILLDILPRLLSDSEFKIYGKKSAKEFIEQKRNIYYKNIEREDNRKEEINFDISKNESVENYYERLFEELEKHFGNRVSENISGISGRLSLSGEVSWSSKTKIKLKSKEIFLNTGIKDSEALDVAKQVYYQINYGLKKPLSNQTVRKYVKSNLNTLNKVPSFHFESLERIQKGYYFTKDKTELGKTGSTPLEFEDAEKQVWYMDMSLTKDEAYSILKNIAIGNKKYSKEL